MSWSHDQLLVNTTTVHFRKILLAQAERAYIKIRLYKLYKLLIQIIQSLVNFEIFKTVMKYFLSNTGLKSPFNL